MKLWALILLGATLAPGIASADHTRCDGGVRRSLVLVDVETWTDGPCYGATVGFTGASGVFCDTSIHGDSYEFAGFVAHSILLYDDWENGRQCLTGADVLVP